MMLDGGVRVNARRRHGAQGEGCPEAAMLSRWLDFGEVETEGGAPSGVDPFSGNGGHGAAHRHRVRRTHRGGGGARHRQREAT